MTLFRRFVLVFTFAVFMPSAASAGNPASAYQLDTNQAGITPLMFAAKSGDTKEAHQLLASGANVNAQAEYGATALIFASSEGHTEIVKNLLEKGADPNLSAHYNMVPLWYAVDKGSLATSKALIEAGAHVYEAPAPSALEHPILHTAAANGRVDIIQLLLENNIDLELRNRFSNNTALAMAVRVGQAEAAQLLIEHGASLEAVTDLEYYNGETALQIAQREGHSAVVALVKRTIKHK